MGLSPGIRTQLESDAAALKGEISRSTVNPAKVGQLLASIRNIAEGAVGSLIASGILSALATPSLAALLRRVGM
jgi:hypothetical protein